jgi:nucleotide sugar dehydrogenase
MSVDIEGTIYKLLNKEKFLGVWGLGYIGYSSSAHFAKKGIKVIGTDVAKEKVEAVHRGETDIPNLDIWLGFDTSSLAKAGLITATADWKELISPDIAAHLLCIPTEKEDRPFDDYLVDVINKLCSYKDMELDQPPLVIIESTLTPNRMEKVVFPILNEHGLKPGKDILMGVAPRRDWFAEPEMTLVTLPRVVGGSSKEATDFMVALLGLVSKTVLPATDHKHAAMVKSIENAYRCVEIQVANQLSNAYPDVNMTEVLKLVGTKWNIGTFHPSVGIGGYCIPLAPKYVIEGSEKAEELTILKTTIESFEEQPIRVANSLKNRGMKNVGILGLAYKGDLKVHILSPTLGIVKRLKEHEISVKVHDPYYSNEEIQEILGASAFEFPGDLSEFDGIVIVADHKLYASIPRNELIENLKKCRVVIDNVGIWNQLDFTNTEIEYHEAGDRGWLS